MIDAGSSSPDHPCEPPETDPATIPSDDSSEGFGRLVNLPDPSAELAPVDHALALVDVVAGYLADGRTGPARAALAALRVVVEGLGTSEGDSTGASARGKVGA